MPFHRFLNAVFTWALERIGDPQKIEDWQRELVAPLPGDVAPPSPAALEEEGQAFMSAMAMLGGGA